MYLDFSEWLPVKVDVPVPVVHRIPHLLNVTVEVTHPPAESLASGPEETSTWRRGWCVPANSRLQDLQNVRENYFSFSFYFLCFYAFHTFYGSDHLFHSIVWGQRVVGSDHWYDCFGLRTATL